MAPGNKRGWRYGIVALWFLACGGVVGKPTVGGESHFLRHCGDGCGDGLTCVSDICTRGCVINQDACSDLARGALCTNASVEPGAIAICDVSCVSDRDCTPLGTGFECSHGFCRGAAPTGPEPMGNAGASSSGGSASGGGSAAAGAGPVGPGQVPARCSLPFDAGGCLAYMPVYAAVDGKCVQQIYGGCNGNDNRFPTIEECMSVCESRPGLQSCPADRPPQNICLDCGPAGGCSKQGTFCAQACDDTHPCDSSSLRCFSGTCQQYGCE